MTVTTDYKYKQCRAVSEPVRKVLARVEKVGELSRGWNAKCPAHDDNRNSLAVGQGDDGRALIFCHAGCPFKKILEALELRACDLFVNDWGRK